MSTSSLTQKTGIKNVAGATINPATEEKQDSIVTAINAVSGLQRSTNMIGNGKIIVGTIAVEVAFTGTIESIVISADFDNTGILYVGKSIVTNLGANAIVALQPGDSITMDYDDSTNAIYVVASVAGQYFYAGALL